MARKKLTALVTGASSGIGLELTKLLAADRYNLVLVARNQPVLVQLKEELEQKFHVEVEYIVKDLSDLFAPEEIYNILLDKKIEIDVLVNNAGFGNSGYFWELETTLSLKQIQTNVLALTYMTRLFLPKMLEKDSGKILNIASTAAFQPGPLMSVYYATKAFVLNFSRALSCELAETGVTATVLCPGPTSTGFQTHAHLQDSRLFKLGVMKVTDVALEGYTAMQIGRSIVVPGLKNKFFAFIMKFIPIYLSNRIIKNLHSSDV